MEGHGGSILSICFAPDGSNTLASCSDDTYICVWNISSGKKLRIFEANDYEVKALSFSPDSLLLASGSDENII